ncbi:hypothetical protein ACVR05_02105 [Streptococcus caprae]|uniref:Uncharacterized protein n=1 Tax=Streptococcus caprae TaxID=1640501 RepID=A0ABV8CWG2_9STRE
MKKTIFNASFEESVNLVKDEYIELLHIEADKKKIIKKILGGLFILLLMLIFLVISYFLDKEHLKFLGMSPIFPTFIFLIFGILYFCLYILDIFKIRNKKILSYYF